MIKTQNTIEQPYSWVIAIASLALLTISAGGYYVVIVGMKIVAHDFAGLRWIPSFAYSAAIFGMGLGGVLIGRWSDQQGVRSSSLVGACMLATGAAIASITTNQWVFLAVHGIAIGLLGNGALFSPLMANATRWFDHHRGVALSIVASAQGVAGALWPLVFRHLMELTSWRQTYRYYAVFALATMIPISLLLRRNVPTKTVDTSSSTSTQQKYQGETAGKNLVLILSMAIVGCCVAMAIPIVHLVSHVTDVGYSLSSGAEILAVLLGCGAIGRIISGTIADRIGGLPVLLISSACQAILLVLYVFVHSLVGLYVLSALFGLAFGGIIPHYTLVIASYFPKGGNTQRIAVVYLFGAIGMALGGWLGGFIFDIQGNYLWAFVAGFLFNIINLILLGSLLIRQTPSLLPPTIQHS